MAMVPEYGRHLSPSLFWLEAGAEPGVAAREDRAVSIAAPAAKSRRLSFITSAL
jgi:hypothetical protein